MALEDFVDPEVGIAVAATTLILSPQVRGFLRRGLVYGLAGAMRAGDAVGSGARNMAQSAQSATGSAGQAVSEATGQADGSTAPAAAETNSTTTAAQP